MKYAEFQEIIKLLYFHKFIEKSTFMPLRQGLTFRGKLRKWGEVEENCSCKEYSRNYTFPVLWAPKSHSDIGYIGYRSYMYRLWDI